MGKKGLEILYFCFWCGIRHDSWGYCEVCGRDLLVDFVEIQKKGKFEYMYHVSKKTQK